MQKKKSNNIYELQLQKILWKIQIDKQLQVYNPLQFTKCNVLSFHPYLSKR